MPKVCANARRIAVTQAMNKADSSSLFPSSFLSSPSSYSSTPSPNDYSPALFIPDSTLFRSPTTAVFFPFFPPSLVSAIFHLSLIRFRSIRSILHLNHIVQRLFIAAFLRLEAHTRNQHGGEATRECESPESAWLHFGCQVLRSVETCASEGLVE